MLFIFSRRMFPTLKIRVAGLDPKEMYLFFLEIVPFDDKRYRYVYHRFVHLFLSQSNCRAGLTIRQTSQSA